MNRRGFLGSLLALGSLPLIGTLPGVSGTVENISKNTIGSVQPCPAGNCVYSGTERIQGLFAWGGAGWVVINGELCILFWGGGHRSYGGNEVYLFKVRTGEWSRLNDPSLFSDAAGSADELSLSPWGDHGEGHPSPPHTYRGMFGLNPEDGGGAEGSLVQLSMSAVSGAALGFRGSHRMDVATKKWTRYAKTISPHPIGYCPVASGPGKFYAGVFSQGAFGGAIQILDKMTREWAVVGCATPPSQFYANQIMDYCPALECLVFIRTGLGGASTTVPQVWTVPVTSFKQGWTLRETNVFDGSLITGHSMNWANFMGEFAIYSAQGQNFVDFLKPPPTIDGIWKWRKQSFTGAAPSNGGGGGYDPSYSRFLPYESRKGFLWFARADGPVQLWTP
jgi:hypothetical protein